MWKTTARRLLMMIPQLIFISLFIFFLAWHMPGDALSGLFNPELPMQRQLELRAEHGLDDPWYQQYWRWVTNIFRGDFGQSFQHARPVMEVIGDRLPATAALAFVTMLFTYAMAIPLGVIAGRRSGTVVDKVILGYVFVMLAVPTIVLALLMIFWFSPIGLGWFPMSGSVDAFVYAHGTSFEIFLSRMHHLFLPAFTGAMLSTIGIVFMLRGNIVERKSADYVTFARSKGVPTSTIFSRHILRNSLVPIVSGIGLIIAALFAGSIFIERMFQYPGMGRLFMDSIGQRDFPVVNAIIMILSALTAVGVLISDILLTVVDPRIRIR